MWVAWCQVIHWAVCVINGLMMKRTANETPNELDGHSEPLKQFGKSRGGAATSLFAAMFAKCCGCNRRMARVWERAGPYQVRGSVGVSDGGPPLDVEQRPLEREVLRKEGALVRVLCMRWIHSTDTSNIDNDEKKKGQKLVTHKNCRRTVRTSQEPAKN